MTFASPLDRSRDPPEKAGLTRSDWNSGALTGVIPTATAREQHAPQAPSPSERTAPKGVQIRGGVYGLGLVFVALFALFALREPSASPKGEPSAAQAAAASAATGERRRPPRAAIQVRTVEAPTVKDAATAFARGDYREALAQYRALSLQQPGQAVYASLIRILERRLASLRRSE